MKFNKVSSELIVLLVSIILTVLIYLKTDIMDYNHPHFKNPWDHHKYLWMAVNNLDFHIAPFCWRIFVPFLASLLPFEISINFQLIALISVILTGFFIFKIGTIVFDNFYQSLSMMVAYFSLGFATRFVIYDFWLVDAFAILLITSGTYFILSKNDLAFFFVLIIGALTKESVLFLLALYYSLQAEKVFDLRMIKKTLIISIVPVTIFILVRILIPAMNSSDNYLQTLPEQLRLVHYESSEYNLDYLINEVALTKIRSFSLKFLYQITIYTFMIHFILSFSHIPVIKKWLPGFLPFLILTYLQIFFVVNDERVVIIGFIPILIFSIAGLQNIFSKLPYQNFSILFINFSFYLLVLFSGLFYSNWTIIRQILILILYLTILLVISFKSRAYQTIKSI